MKKNKQNGEFSKKIKTFLILILFTSVLLQNLSGIKISKADDPVPNKTWDGDGGDDNWSTAANWSDDVKPVSTDDILIDATVTVEVDEDIGFASLKLGNAAGTTAPVLNLTNDITAGTRNIIIENGATLKQNNGITQQVGVFSIRNGGTLTHTPNVDQKLYWVDISASSMTVDSGGSINVDNKGYNGLTDSDFGNGPGGGESSGGAPTGGSGAGHGGNGGNAGNGGLPLGGTAYCDITNPNTLGSAGGGGLGQGPINGQGGGLIKLNVSQDLTLNGTISANGGAGDKVYNGGGAGGAINIFVTNLVGTPAAFRANGGNASADGWGGGGGGGCVLISYSTSSIGLDDLAVLGGSGGSGYWWAAGGQGGAAGLKSMVIAVPTASTSLYTHSSNAQSGDNNPTNLTTLTPVFSAVCNTAADQCRSAKIEVDDDSGTNGDGTYTAPIWASNSINIADVANGVRSENMLYAGSQLNYNTTYYWHVQFSNAIGDGIWSENGTFYVPRGLELYTFNKGGAVLGGSVQNIEWGSYGGGAGETVKLEYSTDNFATATTIDASEASTSDAAVVKSYAWTVPSANTVCGGATCNSVKIRITSNSDSNYYVTSESNFTIQGTAPAATDGIKKSRTFNASSFYTTSNSLVTFTGGNAQYSSSAWYNSSWTKRVPIVISNAGGELSNFQIQFSLTYDSDMQADFDDIRFAASDKTTLIDHWLETKVNSSSATFWIEVPTIAAAGDTTIYMYYGNAGVSSASNCSNTFWLCDDFESVDLNTSLWAATNGTPTIENGKLILDGGDGVSAGITIPADTIWESSAIVSGGTVGTTIRGSVAEQRWVGDGGVGTVDFLLWPPNVWLEFSDAWETSNWGGGVLAYPTDVYKTYKITYLPNDAPANVIYDYDGGARTETHSGILSAENTLYPTLYVNGGQVRYEFIHIRKYAATAPTVGSAGSEMSYGGPMQTLVLNASHPFSSVNSFSATTGGTGTLTFQVTNNYGDPSEDWYYCVGDTLTAATLDDVSTSSLAATFSDECLNDLVAGDDFNVKAFFSVDPEEDLTLSDISFVVISNVAPTVTDGNISIAGATGTGGAYKINDTVTVTWDNSVATGDGNTDIASATADFSQFGGGAAVAMTDTTACSGTNGDDIYEACYTIVAGAVDATNRNVSVTANDTGLLSTTTADATNATVDNIKPVLAEVTPVSNGTDTTPDYTFSSDEVGDITYGGDCTSATTSATSGSNAITFTTLAVGTHSNCTITVTDSVGNLSNLLAVTSFTISAPVSEGGGGGSVILPLPQVGNKPIEPVAVFTDIAGHWAEQYIKKLQQKCDVQGFKDKDGNLLNEYRPNLPISRAEYVKMFMQCKYAGLANPEVDPFTDVPKAEWYAPAIARAKTQRIVDGYQNGTIFLPFQSVNRAEATKMVLLLNYLEDQIVGGINNFTDVPEAAWFTKYINFGVIRGVISGYVDNSGNPLYLFGPFNPLTRAEAAKVITNSL